MRRCLLVGYAAVTLPQLVLAVAGLTAWICLLGHLSP